ncbi:MAG TPA: GNAT family N-acetyltransferase [Capsulimonadaceae bacterium]|nr:GNAT family N-acetyltransferase [Capsulimonadaceae bacterium]
MAVVDVVTEAQGLQDLREEWQQLVTGCPKATVFQSYEWLATWWRFFGKTRPGRRLFVITVRDESGTLIGLAPMMTSLWYGTLIRRVSFLGEGASDYHDVLAVEHQAEEACQAIYSFLARDRSWRVGDLNQLREGGLLRGIAPSEGSGVRYKDYSQEACPYLPYPTAKNPEEKWNALLSTLGKKMRYNVGYYERLLTRTYRLEINIAGSEEKVDEALSALFELHRRRWNERWLPGVFAGRRVQAFHRAVSREFLKNDWLRLHTLRLDGEIQAVLYCFAWRDRTCYYQAGFEPTLARLSLGTVLTAKAIRKSIDEGREQFDFLRGDEPYKERWTRGAVRINSRRLIGRRASPSLPFATGVCRIESSVETRFKHWMHHRSAAKNTARDRTH